MIRDLIDDIVWWIEDRWADLQWWWLNRGGDDDE